MFGCPCLKHLIALLLAVCAFVNLRPTDYTDCSDNRVATTLPDGRVINTLTYGSGHVHQLNIDGEVICDFERDNLHREIERSQGQLTSRYRLDALGRLLESTANHTHPNPQAPHNTTSGHTSCRCTNGCESRWG